MMGDMNADVPGDGGPPHDGSAGDGDEGLISDAEQALSDSDQTLADIDQTASDQDRALADSDQWSSDIDQHASDRDQETADDDARRRAASGADSAAWAAARYASSRADRLASTLARYATSVDRMQVQTRRDETADRRDESAAARDQAADARDRIAAHRDAQAVRPTADPQALADQLAATRLRAGMDRERAAKDRRHAAMDRVQAARDRQFAREALRHAHHDALTGTLNRELGELVLVGEIDRAHTNGQPLTLTCIDVDVLRVLEEEDEAADGELLAQVTAKIRRQLRTFDTLVRYGGDEFVCAMPSTPREEAERQLTAIADAVESECGQPIMLGSAQLERGDALEEIVARATTELAAVRAQRGG